MKMKGFLKCDVVHHAFTKWKIFEKKILYHKKYDKVRY